MVKLPSMKIRILIILCEAVVVGLLMISNLALAQNKAASENPATSGLPKKNDAHSWTVKKRADGLDATDNALRLRIEFRDDKIVRIRRTALPEWAKTMGPAVLPAVRVGVCHVSDEGATTVLTTTKLKVVFDKKHGSIEVDSIDGNTILVEDGATITATTLAGTSCNSIGQHWHLREGELLYGMGSIMADKLQLNGRKIHGQIENIEDPMAVVVSTGGWGLFWDVPSQFDWESTASDMSFTSKTAFEESYYVIAAPCMDDAIDGFRRLTGAAALPPKWQFGYCQSKERYDNQQELVDVGQQFRTLKFPCDVIIQDWFYWADYGWSAPQYDRSRYPDPAAANLTLHDMHFHTLISQWSQFNNGPKTNLAFVALKKKGLVYSSGWSTYCDAFNPETYATLKPLYQKFFWDCGWDGWWLDATDLAENGCGAKPSDRTALGPLGLVWNAYPLAVCQAIHDLQVQARPDKRVAILTRGVYPGLQRTGAMFWTGDIDASWDVLRRQVVDGLNTCLSGIPYWNTDIGGFTLNQYPQGCESTEYRELYVRWFQFGTFFGMFRSHGTQTPREPWRFGKPGETTYDTLLRFANLRYRLMPYLYSCAWNITSQNGTLMRALVMDFPKDPVARVCPNQFMFGPALMVCPVLNSQLGWEKIGSEHFIDATGKVGGLTATYYLGTNFGKIIASRFEPMPVIPVTQKVDGLPNEHYSVRWIGTLATGPAPATYKFNLAADDGYRLTLDGKTVIEDWTTHPTTSRTASIDLPANSQVPIVIEYFQDTAGQDLELKITSKNNSKPVDISREVVLPAGTDWYDFWTGERFAGGRQATPDAPLNRIPLYLRAGSIVPMGPTMQYTSEKPTDPLEIRVCPGADGTFTLYEDAGEGFAYQKGKRSEIQLAWNDKAGILTIGKRHGSFPGMLKQRTVRAVLVRNGVGGVDPVAHADVEIVYDGAALGIPLKQ